MHKSKSVATHVDIPQVANLPKLMRLPQVLAQIPVSRSAWWSGIKDGRFPQGVKLGPKTTVWHGSDIEQLVARLRTEQTTSQ